MPHLDAPPRTHAPLAAPLPSTAASVASVSSPDELSMFEVFDEDGDISGLPDALFKPEGASYESMVSDNSATLHALEVLASLDDYDRTASGRSADLSGHASGSASDDKPSTGAAKTKMTAEEKKRRNRDCMRRLRNRRNDLITSMRREIQALEARLNQQLEISSGDSVAIQHTGRPENPETDHHALRKLQLGHARVKTAMRRLREENYWLQKQIAQRQESLDAVRQIAQARDEAWPPVDLDALEEEDIGVWIRNTDHFFPPVEDARAFEIVMESYRIIQEGIRITERMKSPPNAVLGWSDQRSVDQHWANFMMQKTFPHESPRLLALKTWKLMSQVAEINVLQPKAHEMKVLQRLNEYTLVIARHTYFEDSKFSYCMIYLLFLLETENGFVVGSRSLDPDEHRMKAFMAERMVVAKPFHCFHFQPDAASGGCKLTFAGRVDNVIGGCAKNCAMDMLLAMMRWESHCVSPLWRLAT